MPIWCHITRRSSYNHCRRCPPQLIFSGNPFWSSPVSLPWSFDYDWPPLSRLPYSDSSRWCYQTVYLYRVSGRNIRNTSDRLIVPRKFAPDNVFNLCRVSRWDIFTYNQLEAVSELRPRFYILYLIFPENRLPSSSELCWQPSFGMQLSEVVYPCFIVTPPCSIGSYRMQIKHYISEFLGSILVVSPTLCRVLFWVASRKCNATPLVCQRVKHPKSIFGYGESNPELPRSDEPATENCSDLQLQVPVRGGNVSRYTISDFFLSYLQNIYIPSAPLTPTDQACVLDES